MVLRELEIMFGFVTKGSWKRYFTVRRMLVNTALGFYCLILFLAFDFAWSSLTMGAEQTRLARIANPVYDHGFAPNFDGYDVWGELRYRLVTNSLGFKDASVRDVPMKAATRRILLIGDSFAEGIGMTYEDSFAGLLDQAGQKRSERVEFLNAGVASYSPSIYYKKIKFLLDSGLQFDEVVLFSDTSDVTDEANSYFCIDDDPKYHSHCTKSEGSMQAVDAAPKKPNFLIDRFVINNRIRIAIKRWTQSLSGNQKRALSTDYSRIGWTNPKLARRADYQPLGVDGGIARSLQNMRALSDLLAARNIPLTIVVYPWAQQIAQGDRDSRQVKLWRDFCEGGAARHSSTSIRHCSRRPTPTRTGMSASTLSATIIFRRPATALCSRKCRSESSQNRDVANRA